MAGLIASDWGRFKMQMSKAGFFVVWLAVLVVVYATLYWTFRLLEESFWGRFMMQKSWAGFDVEGLVQLFLVVGGIVQLMLSFLVASCWRRFKMQMSWAAWLDEGGLANNLFAVVAILHYVLIWLLITCSGIRFQMQMSWAGSDVVDLGSIICGVVPICCVVGSFSWVFLGRRFIRWRMLKAQASYRRNDEELVVQQVLNQRDGRSGSSEDFLAINVTSENEVRWGDAEDMDRPLGSPDKSQWTAHSPFASANDETSETEKRDREAQLQRAMLERLVRDDWPVYSREWVRFGKKIAEGGQAEIYAAYLKPPNNPSVAVAVKKFKIINGISQGHNPPELKSWQRILNVCRATGVFFNGGQLCLVMPRLDGDLRAVIDGQMKLHSAPPFPKPVAVHIIVQLAMGLKSLHEVGIYHRDLKAANILVKELKVYMKSLDLYKVYISDFESSDDVIGTGFYRAPEVLRHLQARSQGRTHGPVRLCEQEWAAADVYSFGMVCYEILTGKVPMIGGKLNDYSMALSGHRPELPPAIVPDGLRIMIERCWHEDPQCRPTPSEIIHYLKRIDNDGVYIPARMTAGMEILVDVLDYVFQPVSFLRQQLFLMEIFFQILGHIVPRWYLEEFHPCDADVWRDWDNLRESEPDMVFHAALMHQNQFALTDGLHIVEKMALLREFVKAQLAAGVWMPSVWYQSEVIIQQMSDTMHRWGLRLHLSILCVMDLLEIEMKYSLLYFVFLSKWLCMKVILFPLFSPGKTFFWYRDMSIITIGIGILRVMPYIGARAHPHPHPYPYWRLLSLVCIISFYAFFVGNGERFKYLCLLDLVYTIVRDYGEYKLAGFSPHYYFDTISRYTYT